MKNIFQNFSIRGKLLSGFGIIVLIILASGVWELIILQTLEKERTISTTTVKTSRQLNESRYAFNAEIAVIEEIINSNTDSEIQKGNLKHIENKTTILQLFKGILNDTQAQTKFEYNKENQHIKDTIVLLNKRYKELLPVIDELISQKKEIIDPMYSSKNLEISLKNDTTISTDTTLTEKNTSFEENDFEAQQEQIKTELLAIIKILKLTAQISITVEQDVEKQTIELYKTKANDTFAFVIFVILISVIIALLISRSILRPIAQLQDHIDELTAGNLPEEIKTKTADEIGDIGKALNKLASRLRKTADFSLEIGKRDFKTSYTTLGSNDILGNSLLAMRDSLQKATEEEDKRKIEDSQRNRSSEGQAMFAEILRHNNENINELSSEIISNLVKFLNANQGGIFILNDEDKNNVYLELLGAYAYNRKKYLAKRVQLGEGLVGSVAVEKYTIHMTDIPNEYIEIESGTGSSNPKSILIVPLKIENKILGVIELASFNTFEQYEIELAEKIAENTASTLSTSRINTRTAKLLEQSEQQAGLMKEQEEAMLQNIEELKATQEESTKREQQLKKTLSDLNQTQQLIERKDQKRRDELIRIRGDYALKSEQLKIADQYNELLTEASLSAIIIFDAKNKVELFNYAAQKLWGYKKSEALGRYAPTLFPKELEKYFTSINGEFNLKGNLLIGKVTELSIKNKEGKKLPTIISIHEIKVKEHLKYVFFIKDISEEKKSEQNKNAIIEKLMATEFEMFMRIEKLEKTLSRNNLEIPKTGQNLLNWSTSYIINLNIIDQQHKKWIQIINKFYNAFKEAKPTEELAKVTSELIDYTDYHFSFEEKYMEDFNYENFENHKKKHQFFITKISEFKQNFDDGKVGIPYKLMNTIRQWVKAHIIDDDAAYVPLFKKNGLT